MSDEDMSLSDSNDSEDDESTTDYSQILQGLVDSGTVHIITSDAQTCCDINRPKVKNRYSTETLKASEFYTLTQCSSGLTGTKTRMPTLKSENVASQLLNRERGVFMSDSFPNGTKRKLSNNYLPNSNFIMDNCSSKVFCGLFSRDGNNFITASQDRYVRVYDSSDGSYKLFKTVRARDVGWSIIDVAFSPDRKHFVYSTWSTSLHLCPVSDNSDLQQPLALVKTSRRFCVFSVVFSSDGKELLSGANDGCLYIYDIERNQRTSKISAHEYDVNNVIFADDSSHIIYSGGDDGLIKVWDRRTLSESGPKHIGVLAGHFDGVTFIDSKGDGRHLISNSKDQSIKLWDVRVFSSEKAAEGTLQAVQQQSWDYRWQEVPKKLYRCSTKLKGDTSIMTYKGHSVKKTLVRCRFSPLETTGQRFIYTGCGHGNLIIYDALTGKIERSNGGHTSCVRDVSWHPTRNEILSSSWDGVVLYWTYKDLSSEGEQIVPCSSKPRPLRKSLRLASRKETNR